MTDVPFNSYRVTFEYETFTLSTVVFAMHEDAAEGMAIDYLIEEAIYPPSNKFCEFVTVELMDENVL